MCEETVRRRHAIGQGFGALLEGGLRGRAVPGKMQSAAPNVIDVMALPRENSLAIFCAGKKFAHSNQQSLSEMPVALVGVKDQHTLKCAIRIRKTYGSSSP